MKIAPDSFIAVMISGFGIMLCLSVGIKLFFRNSGLKQANTLLGLLLVLYSLTLFNALMAMTGVYSTYQYLYFLPLVFSLSLGPLFFFFVKSRIEPSFQMSRRDIIHFILPAAQFIFYLSIGFRSAEFKSWMWRNVISPWEQYVEETLSLVLGIGYIIASISMINRKIPTSLWKHPVCNWLKQFAYSLLILLSISMMYEIIDWILWNSFEYNLYNTPWADFPLKMSYAFISIFIGYHAFVYQNQALITPRLFKQDDVQEIEVKINELILNKKVYLDPELSVESFSKMLGIHKNNISKYFSSKGESFRSFINKQRIDHFISLVHSEKQQKLSLLGLAFESGFNSKASFNRIFKEMKGQTPKEYIQAA